MWLNQGVGNKNNFLEEFKIKLNDNFVQNWNSRISESSRATFYSLSSNFNFQLFSKPVQQERVHLQFCKKLLGVKKSTQNDFIHGELGRVSLQTSILYSVINYWFKILESE